MHYHATGLLLHFILKHALPIATSSFCKHTKLVGLDMNTLDSWLRDSLAVQSGFMEMDLAWQIIHGKKLTTAFVLANCCYSCFGMVYNR
jgi:hypothetical protein